LSVVVDVLPFLVAFSVVEQVWLKVNVIALLELLGVRVDQAFVYYTLDQLLGFTRVVSLYLRLISFHLLMVFIVDLLYLIKLLLFLLLATQQLDCLFFVVAYLVWLFELLGRLLMQELSSFFHLLLDLLPVLVVSNNLLLEWIHLIDLLRILLPLKVLVGLLIMEHCLSRRFLLVIISLLKWLITLRRADFILSFLFFSLFYFIDLSFLLIEWLQDVVKLKLHLVDIIVGLGFDIFVPADGKWNQIFYLILFVLLVLIVLFFLVTIADLFFVPVLQGNLLLLIRVGVP
jgi:hypothetical protein